MRRSAEAQAYRHFYKTARWQRIRQAQLQAEPLCERCKAKGFLVPASVVHHVDKASKSTEAGFFAGPFMSLCAPCHDGAVQSEEATGRANDRIGFIRDPDEDGWPSDPRHPANRR